MSSREALLLTTLLSISRTSNGSKTLPINTPTNRAKDPANFADLCALEVEIGDNVKRELLEAPSIKKFRHAQRDDPECSRIFTWTRLNQFPIEDNL